MRRPPVWLFAVLCLLVAGAGWTFAQTIGESPYASVTDTIRTKLPGETTVRTIRRVTKGRVVTLAGGERVVHVPLLIVHVDHKTIRVPAHNLPIHHKHGDLHAAIVAEPLVPVTVTVYLPSEPLLVPTTVTSTVTETEFVPTTITVTLPLDTTSPPPGND